jgi:hypothetical protein
VLTEPQTLLTLRQIARLARKAGHISAPTICKHTHRAIVLTDPQLEELAQQGYLELSNLSGIVPCYQLTVKAYNALEVKPTHRLLKTGIIDV